MTPEEKAREIVEHWYDDPDRSNTSVSFKDMDRLQAAIIEALLAERAACDERVREARREGYVDGVVAGRQRIIDLMKGTIIEAERLYRISQMEVEAVRALQSPNTGTQEAERG